MQYSTLFAYMDQSHWTDLEICQKHACYKVSIIEVKGTGIWPPTYPNTEFNDHEILGYVGHSDLCIGLLMYASFC